MNIKKILQVLLVGAGLLLFGLVQSGLAATGSLVSVEWLAKNLHRDNMVILDVGAFTHYEKGHIPGAVKAFGPWQTMDEDFVGFMMPPVADLEAMLRSYGVNNNSQIVLYDEGVTAEDTAKSARALWSLHVLGHTKVAILDGGFAGWEFEEQAVSQKAATPSKGNFTASVQKDKVVDLAQIKKKLGNVVLVDTRLPEEHFGHEKKSHIKRAGHLPGSMLWPAVYMTNAGVELSPSFFKDTATLAKMAAGVGIPDDKTSEIIVYSNHGLSAALDYFTLHDLLGYSNVKIFDGSVLQAAAAADVPMEMDSWGYKKL